MKFACLRLVGPYLGKESLSKPWSSGRRRGDKKAESSDGVLLTCRLYCWRGGGNVIDKEGKERLGIRWSSFSLARMSLSNLRQLGRVMAQIER